MISLFLLAGASCAAASEGLEDGRYAVEVRLSGGSGRVHVETPAVMVAEDGDYFARIIWSSSQYDTLHIAGITYDNQSEEGENSCFQIPISAFDKEIEIVAGTHILGEPHEIPYSLRFYADSIGPENPLPKEAAKRVLAMAALIVIAGGILNHFSKGREDRIIWERDREQKTGLSEKT